MHEIGVKEIESIVRDTTEEDTRVRVIEDIGISFILVILFSFDAIVIEVEGLFYDSEFFDIEGFHWFHFTFDEYIFMIIYGPQFISVGLASELVISVGMPLISAGSIVNGAGEFNIGFFHWELSLPEGFKFKDLFPFFIGVAGDSLILIVVEFEAIRADYGWAIDSM